MEAPIAPLACVDEDAPNLAIAPNADLCGRVPCRPRCETPSPGRSRQHQPGDHPAACRELREQQAGQVMYYILTPA